MDNFTRPNQQVNQTQHNASKDSFHSSTGASNHRSGKFRHSKKLMISIVSLGVILLMAVAGYLIAGWLLQEKPDKDNYQAVFLTNGQVYFGKLDKVNQNYVQLSDIYYLQVNQSLQADSSDEQAEQKQTSDDMQLIKLGDELHGPQDQMQINGEQILFWENLKSDGKVATAIADHKKQ